MAGNDIRTLGYVLRRTNYGEADRILNLITSNGKLSAIAKGVRKEKSKLAGSIEMFTLTDFNIHQGRSEFGIITGAKMVEHYGGILKDFNRLEKASLILKKISLVSENSDSPEYFKIVQQCLKGLNSGMDEELVYGWFSLNVSRAMGEEVNLYRDVTGRKLLAELKYSWDGLAGGFIEDTRGEYGENEIKLLRMMASTSLGVVNKVKANEKIFLRVFSLIKIATSL
ncbi:DNA repair protein RecO [Candidatus Saccharibacteria bacterium]|nr:DNA repair protein RecO [Candidatus Saccharibacteria bacterium]